MTIVNLLRISCLTIDSVIPLGRGLGTHDWQPMTQLADRRAPFFMYNFFVLMNCDYLFHYVKITLSFLDASGQPCIILLM